MVFVELVVLEVLEALVVLVVDVVAIPVVHIVLAVLVVPMRCEDLSRQSNLFLGFLRKRAHDVVSLW